MRGYPKDLHCSSCGEYTVEYGPVQSWGERSRWCPSCAEEGLRNLHDRRDQLAKELADLDKRIPECAHDIIKTKIATALAKKEKKQLRSQESCGPRLFKVM